MAVDGALAAAGEPALDRARVQRRAVVGVMALGVRGLAVRALGLLGTLVLARLLTPSEFGVVAVGLTFVMFGRFVADAGIGAALMQREQPPTRRELEATSGFQVVVTTAVLVLVAAVALPFGEAGLVTVIMCASLVLECVRVPATIVASRDLRYGPQLWGDLADTLVFYGWSIAGVALGFGIWSLATGAIARAIVKDVVIIRLTGIGTFWPRLALAEVRPLLSFGLAFQAAPMVTLIRDQGANVLTGLIAGTAAVGYWNLTYRILGVVMLLYIAVRRVAFPAFARLRDAGGDPAAVLPRTLLLLTIGGGLLLVPLIGSAPVLATAAFGPAWARVGDILPAPAIGLLAGGPIVTALLGYLYAIGDARTVVRGAVWGALAWLAVGFPLLPVLGVELVGYGLCVGLCVEAAVLYVGARRTAALPLAGTWALPVALALLASAAGWLVALALGDGIGSAAAAGTAAEVALLVALLTLRREACRDCIRVLRGGLRAEPRTPKTPTSIQPASSSST